jgi:acyl-CoA reductase-like NAD-dependent aldehyde dehydrogenase
VIAIGGDLGRGHFHQPTIFQPTIFGRVKASMRVAQEEIFGLVTTLIPIDAFDEAIAAADACSTASPPRATPPTFTGASARCRPSTPG